MTRKDMVDILKTQNSSHTSGGENYTEMENTPDSINSI